MKTNKTIKKILSIALCLALVMSCVPAMGLSALGADAVVYIDENGNTTTYTGAYTEVTSTLTSWSNGWYVVSGNVTIANRVTVSGTVNLILTDGANLTAKAGIAVNNGNTFIIYAQSEEGAMGKFTAKGEYSQAAIGGDDEKNSGVITINGGFINAKGGDNSPGIGGGSDASGNVRINGGVIYAEPGYYKAAAIGSGVRSSGVSVNSTITITGGTVVANGYIGSYKDYNTGSNATVTVTGGNIKATDIFRDLSSGADNGSESLTRYEFNLAGIEHKEIAIDGLPSYYNIDNCKPIDGVYYLWLPSDFVRGSVYLDGVKYIYTNGTYTHTCEFSNGFCACGEYEPATETNDKYDIDGDGYTAQVYEIANAGQLYWFSCLVNGTLEGVQQNERANAVLTADIVVNKNVLNDDYSLNGDGSNFREWVIMDTYFGVFNGAGHYISGLYTNETEVTYTGLFWCMYGKLENLGIIDSYFYVNCSDYLNSAGAICTVTGPGATITNCYVEANVSTPYGRAGGLVGYGQMGDNKVMNITNCYFIGLVNSDEDFGPFIGNENATFTNCYYDNSLYTGLTTKGEIGVTSETFASGGIAYLLNNSSPDGIWRQTIGEAAYPNFRGEKVYYGYSCKTEEFVGYTNELAYPTQPHYDENGFCAICGSDQPATLNENGFYEVYNVGNLYWFASKVSSFNNSMDTVYNAILMNDIVINENLVEEDGNLTESTSNLRKWTPISNGSQTFFNGVFDGNYHTISGVYVNDESLSYSAFFGSIRNGIVKNLGITDSFFNGTRSAAFAGTMNGTIENCFVTDSAIDGEYTDAFVVSYSGTNEDFDYPCFVKKSYSTAIVEENGLRVQSAYLSELISESSYYLNDTDNGEGGKNAEQFASGEVAYLLGSPWGQELEKDDYPVFNGKTVYKGFDCGGTDEYYSNTELLDGNDNNHIHGEWTYSDTNGVHQRYSCTREGCSQYLVLETANCSGGTATCQEKATCSVCEYGYGDYDYDNHTTTKTYMTHGDENGHLLYHECCDTLISTIPHSYEGYDFDSSHHWHACECGYLSEVVKEKHTFDANGFCTVCDGYEPAPIAFDAENYTYNAEISNAGQLFWYAENWNLCTVYDEEYNEYYETSVGAVLLKDIDLNPGYSFNENGTYSVDESATNCNPEIREWRPIQNFTWVNFDGNGFTISGLYINTPDIDNVGLFAMNDYYTIKNLTLKNGYVRGGDNTAALVGYNTGSIENCHSDVSVVGNGTIGGIAAYSGGYVSYCSNSGSVVIYGASSATGGIVGNAYGGITIDNCYNTGYIKGGIQVGGILGGGSEAEVKNCYNTGLILSNFSDAHGISGYGTIENSYTLGAEDDGANKKTKAQFESGEVAYLLQQGNTEQVWGQDSNQPGSIPVFDTTGLYKVVKIGETGNYSVANIGDTNDDGVVDVYDYQMLVNVVLTEDSENEAKKQIETESYNSIIRYDIDGDGYLDVLDASQMEKMINGHGTVKAFAVGDLDYDGVSFEDETEIKLIAEKISAPEKLSTSQKYACDITADGKVDYDDLNTLTSMYPLYFVSEE